MEKLFNKNKNIVPIIMILFIYLQPLLDLSTSFSKLVLNMDITPGIIIRFLFMAVGGLYILYKSFKDINKRYLIYLIVLGIFFILNLTISYFNKPVFSLTSEITSIGKIVYFVLLFLVFILSFQDLKKTRIIEKYFPHNIAFSQLVISLSMLVAAMTNTNIEAYDGILKTGNSGWFFAANEISTLLAICFPVLIWFATKQKNLVKLFISWIIVIGSSYALIAIGTKVGYLAVLISFLMTISGLIFELVNKSGRTITDYKMTKWALVLASFTIFVFLTPEMPVAKNTSQHIIFVDNTNQSIKEETDDADNFIFDDIKDTLTGNQAGKKNTRDNLSTKIIFSGRDVFLQNHIDDYNEAPTLQKIFGMGYSANYTERPIIIERDFHDIFFQYGWVGTFLIFLPFIYYGLKLVVLLLKNLLEFLNVKYILIFSGVLLGLGIAFISGHALTAPAVSSYLSLILGYIVVDLELNKHEMIKKRNGGS